MCGIAGIWNRDGGPVEEDLLVAMRRALEHRGPDSRGLLLQESLGIAHCRLSIMDPSANSDQPLSTPDGELVLSFNGEIHNYLEIRSDLEKLGSRFRSTGDTEVVLEAFRRWGPGCFSRFNGMWGLALWDRRRRRLVLSRDRFGLKPLFYSERGPRLAFASEIKGLLAAFPEEAEIDESELAAYLLGANPDSGIETFYRNIRAVPPATFLTATLDGLEPARNYWDFEPGTMGPPEHPEESFRELLRDAVRLRLRSDTPVGACVSGGLDSSSVAMLSEELSNRPIHCFSLKFPDHPSIDESSYAAEVLSRSDRFITHWVCPQPTGLVETMELIVRANDAPSPLRGRLGMWEIFRAAHRHVKVVLIGEGGDELLAGYRRFLVPYLIDLLRPGSGNGTGAAARATQLSALLPWFWPPRFNQLLDLTRPLLRRHRLYSRADETSLNRDFAPLARSPSPERFFHAFLRGDIPRPFASSLNNALWQEFRYCGIPELVRAEDALAMASSLETRAPFLDHRLVEFCFRLPPTEKVADGWTKSLLRRAMKGGLPERIRLRRQKVGLPTPYLSYFQDPVSLRRLRELLLEGQAVRRGILDRRRLELELRRLVRPNRFSRQRLPALWRYACTEIWLGQLDEYRARVPGS
ncbi:MAG: asparagine synthase (glutamine-hydrolyzing) [Acidobacteriota bacterium]